MNGNLATKLMLVLIRKAGLAHSLEVTTANVHDVTMTSELLTGEEEVVYGDSGYIGAEKRDDAITRNKHGKKIKYKINRKPSQIKRLSKSGQYKTKRMNTKNLLFVLKLNMSSLLSKIFSLFVKLDIEANESSLLN